VSSTPADLARRVLVVAVLGAAACSSGAGRGAAFERRADQNVLLVTIDTLRADALSSYGGAAKTPNLDALASRGTRFTFAHAHAVLTRPSHASILTGLYPYEHGVRDHSGYRITPGTATLATLLKAQGFATGAFVGGAPLMRAFGLDAGFDVYDDHFARSAGSDFTLAERPAGAVVEAATKWIGTQQGRWFAWVHVFDPHAPYQPPAPFDKEYATHPYYGEVAYVDQALAPLLDLAGRGARPTVVLVTGDHGEGLGDHGELTHGTFAYEPTLHVPLILAQLPSRGAGVVSDTPARHIDVVPTLLDAVGAAVPASLHGRSLAPGAPVVADADVTSYFEAMSAMLNRGWAPLSGVVAGREKFIDLPRPELYELPADPAETSNLADRRADRRRALEIRLRDFHAAPPGERVSETPEVAATLQSLGYTSGRAPRKAAYTDADDPKNLVQLDQWIQQGIEAWQLGRHEEALAIYRRLIAARPSMAIGYKNLAFLQWQGGDARAAIATLEQGLRAGAADPAVTTQLGSYLAEAGKASDAIALLEPLTAGATADADALNSLGVAYARAGQDGKAAAAFQRVLARDPRDGQALENLGTLALQHGDFTAAEHALRQAVAADPRSARAHNGLGVVAMKTGRRDEAFAEWKQAVALAPHDFDALFNLAMELDAAGRHDEARPYLARFAAEAPPAQYAADIARVRKVLER
jgi:arylsulfatase A-like enzyme/Tfp pilus assembly protein PilF